MERITSPQVIVVVSADEEWRATRDLFTNQELCHSPLGDWFSADLTIGNKNETVVFFHGGWGKISAAASAQYVIDRWSPSVLFNLGTCGGFEGDIERGTIILAESTIVYDIIEQMRDMDTGIRHYTTKLDLDWLDDDYPQPVLRTVLVSGDRDLVVHEIDGLRARHGAVAGDWESGAIAWVAARNNTRCLILRGVSDIVGPSGAEAYAGDISIFENAAAKIMKQLIEFLPYWIEKCL